MIGADDGTDVDRVHRPCVDRGGVHPGLLDAQAFSSSYLSWSLSWSRWLRPNVLKSILRFDGRERARSSSCRHTCSAGARDRVLADRSRRLGAIEYLNPWPGSRVGLTPWSPGSRRTSSQMRRATRDALGAVFVGSFGWAWIHVRSCSSNAGSADQRARGSLARRRGRDLEARGHSSSCRSAARRTSDERSSDSGRPAMQPCARGALRRRRRNATSNGLERGRLRLSDQTAARHGATSAFYVCVDDPRGRADPCARRRRR